jgi:hypothetical protein
MFVIINTAGGGRMKCAGWVVMLGLMFALPAQAAEEVQPEGSKKEAKQPAEEGKAAADKEASGEKKKKEGEKKEGGGSEPGCD